MLLLGSFFVFLFAFFWVPLTFVIVWCIFLGGGCGFVVMDFSVWVMGMCFVLNTFVLPMKALRGLNMCLFSLVKVSGQIQTLK